MRLRLSDTALKINTDEINLKFHFFFTEIEKSFRYTVYLSDECILAPMALFHTELLDLTYEISSSRIRFMGANPGDPEDPHDHIYLSETSRKYTKVI